MVSFLSIIVELVSINAFFPETPVHSVSILLLSKIMGVILLPQWMKKLSPMLLRPEFSDNPEKPCRVIVEMVCPATERIRSYVETNGGKIHREHRIMPFIVAELPYTAVQYLGLSKYVRRIWHYAKIRTMLNVAVPAVGSNQVHRLGFTGKNVAVAVIDTGIAAHPDLVYPENRIAAWYDIVNERTVPYDDNGHGTHVSGIIAGNGRASCGKYAGMAPEAKLIGIKALDRDGSGNTSDIISGIEWCIENQKTYNIKAINLSIGAPATESYRADPLCRAVSAAWNKGIVVCVAAGNDGPEPGTINTPAINPNAISVGNLDDKGTIDVSDDVINDSSSRGPTVDRITKPDLLAPGTNIMSLRPGWSYRRLSGTSMATPMVTGAVAQMLQKWPDLKPAQVKSKLRKNARDFGLQPVFQGSGALVIGDIFKEAKKGSSKEVNSMLTKLFGKDSVLNSLFGKDSILNSLLGKDSILNSLFSKKSVSNHLPDHKSESKRFWAGLKSVIQTLLSLPLFG